MEKICSYIFYIIFSLFPSLFSKKILRRHFTKSYTSGLLAIGESFARWKAIGPRWIFSNINNSDINIALTPNSVLPFPSESIKLIYSAHMIEHLTYDELKNFIAECARILKIGGGVRFEAPDAAAIIDSYKRKGLLYHKFYRELQNIILPLNIIPPFYDQPHVGTLGVLSGEVIDNTCVPIYCEKKLFDENIERPLSDFDRWLDTLKTAEQKDTHGHNTLIYFEKLEFLFKKYGNFTCYYGSYGESNIKDFMLNKFEKRHKNNIIEAPHRADYSIYFEAIKN